jgi:plastocyanin
MRTLRRWIARGLLVLAALPALATLASAATVNGRINGTLPPLRKSPDLYGKYRRGQPAPELPNPLLVVLMPADGSTPPTVTKRPVIDQKDERFQPSALVVQTGTTVGFLNSDAYYHNVFSLSAPRKFDLGRYRKGTSRPVTFDKPGLVRLFCDIHPGMLGYVLVTPSPWGAAASPEGNFAITDVPPGRYDVLVWHEPLTDPVRIDTVTIEAESPPLDLTLAGR